jgi:hypothetical protein
MSHERRAGACKERKRTVGKSSAYVQQAVSHPLRNDDIHLRHKKFAVIAFGDVTITKIRWTFSGSSASSTLPLMTTIRSAKPLSATNTLALSARSLASIEYTVTMRENMCEKERIEEDGEEKHQRERK